MSLDLAAIEARAAAATPGPWVVQRCIDGRESINAPEWDGGVWVAATEDYATDYATEDAEFIARAREDVPALVAEVKRLREAVASLGQDRLRRIDEIKTARETVERLRLDLGAIAELTRADRPYDWRLEQIRVITTAAARSALDGAS